MAFLPGFNYLQGKYELRWSAASSSQTIHRGNVVTLDARRFVALAASDSTAIYGIAQADSDQSLSNAPSGFLPILVPYPDTVFAAPVQTGVAVSATSIGQSYNIEGYLANGDLHHRVDTDSAATAMVTLVANGFQQNAAASDESFVYCVFNTDVIGVFRSDTSTNIFAQT